MKTDLYTIFVKVSETLNFSKAADELFLSQPAVSQSIAQLERQLGQILFERLPRGVRLTPEGEDFYQKVAQGLSLIRQAELELKDVRELRAGRLRIGVSPIVARYRLPEILKRFRENYPLVRVRILSGTTKDLADGIQSGSVDLVIGFRPDGLRDVEFHRLLDVQDIFVAQTEIAKTLPQPLAYQDLRQQHLIMLDQKSETRRKLDDYLRRHDIELQPEIELADYDLLLAFAKQGLGLASVFKEFHSEPDLQEIQLEKPLPKRALGYYYRKAQPLSPSATALIQLLQEY